MSQKYFTPEAETMSREELEALQSRRLKDMVRRCYDNVPLYRQRFDEIGLKPEDINGIEDIEKLPFTYKADLRDNYPLGMLAVPREKLSRVHASSGTTGKQTVVAYTKEDLDMWATCCARALTAIGTTADDFVHVSYGYGLFTGGLGIHYGAEKLGAAVIPVSTGNTNRQIAIFQDYGSDIMCCTPSYALYIGETMRDMGIDPSSIRLRAGFFGAEPWTEEMRQQIQNLLGIKAYDIYGLSETCGPGVAFECTEQNGMHINEDFFYAEVIDPDTGKVLPDGEYGELVFTCFAKQALPLIRYRTRDICALSREKCACGRTFIKMTKPRGRSDDMLIIRGINVFPSQVESVLLSLGMQPNYLLEVDRVNNLDTLTIKIEMTPDMLTGGSVREIEAVERKVASAMQSTLNISPKIRFVEPKSLPRSEGKAVRIVDKRKI